MSTRTVTDKQQPSHLYLKAFTVFHTGQLFDFHDLCQQIHETELLRRNLVKQGTNLAWDNYISRYRRREYVDKNSPPKMDALLQAGIDERLSTREIVIHSAAGEVVCPLSHGKLWLYPFNTGILECRIAVPPAHWQDTALLKSIIAEVNAGFNDANTIAHKPWVNQFLPILTDVLSDLQQAVQHTHIAFLKAPFLDVKQYLQSDHIIQGSHVALVACYPDTFDVNGPHLQAAMINIAASGVVNAAKSDAEFAFTESHDSLFCVTHQAESIAALEQYVDEKWLCWIRFHEFSWKMHWELDLILTSVLNATITKLKKTQFMLESTDIYRVNAFLNYMWLCFDSHHPRNLGTFSTSSLTLFIDATHYMTGARENWHTDVISREGIKKMAALERLIKQMYEFSNNHRTRTVEKFLAILGIFGLGSFVVSYFSSMEYTRVLGDIGHSVVLVASLGFFAYFLFRAMK